MSLLGQLTSILPGAGKSPPQAGPVYNLPPGLCLPGRSYGTYEYSIHVYQIIEGRIRMQKDPFPAQKSGNVGLDHICVSLSWYSLQYDYDYVKRKAVHMFVWGGCHLSVSISMSVSVRTYSLRNFARMQKMEN